VASVDGRKEDYLILRDGTRAGSMLGRIFKDIDVVREAQFVQERPGVATLRIVRANAYSPEWETRIAQRLDEVLAGKLDVDITYVSRIGRTAGGKTRFVVSCADDAGVSAPAAAYLGSSSPVNVATR
jgi:phenylacetate-CoA ligase